MRHRAIYQQDINNDMKKKIVITLSRVFPKPHPRHGERTHFKELLGNTLNHGHGKRKLHTIRKNYDRWAHNISKINSGGFYLSVRQWHDKPYRSHQDELYQIFTDIGYQRITLIYNRCKDELSCYINGIAYDDVVTLAANDGLSLDDFKAWFFPPGTTTADVSVIHGIIIHFTDFRY